MRKLYKPGPKDAVCIWSANSWEEHFLKFTKFYTFLPLMGASIGAS